MKKRLTAFIIILVLTVSALSAVYGAGDIVDIFVNNIKVQLNTENANIPNLLYDGKTYVSLRDICNLLGIEIQWDSSTKTAKLIDETRNTKSSQNNALNIFLYLISKTFQISGLLLMMQVVFSRMRKDLYFIRKFNFLNTGLKRLIYTNAVIRIGFYFMLAGIFMGFLATHAYPPVWINVILIPLMVILFWFFGMCAANSISKREISELLENKKSLA